MREREQRDENDISYRGPYNVKYKCAYGHPLNGQGRCEPLNQNPPECPPTDAEE